MRCIRGPGGLDLGLRGCVRGACVGHWAERVCSGACGSLRRVFVGCRLLAVRLARREGLWRACVGVQAGEGRPVSGGPKLCAIVGVCARVCMGHWDGVGREGQGGWGWVHVRFVGVRACLQRCARVVSCRPGGLEEKLAVFRGRGKDFADECAYLVHILVGGWKRVLQGWAKAHAPEDPVDGVVPADEGALWPRGESFRVSGPASTCVRAVGMAQIQGTAPVDGQRRLIHWDS